MEKGSEPGFNLGSTAILRCFTEARGQANGSALQEERCQLCKQKPGGTPVVNELTCAVDREGISCAGKPLAETGLLTAGRIFHSKL